MNDLDEIEFKIFLTTSKTMDKFKSVWQDNVHISYCADQLKLTVNQLSQYSVTKQKSPKGITVSKKTTRILNISELFAIKQALFLYYQANTMIADAAQFEYPKRKLDRMTDDSLYMEASQVFERANALAPELLPYKITQTQITQFGADIVNFRKLILQLKHALKAKVKNNQQIKVKIKACKLMLNDLLDVAVSIYLYINAEFYKSYFKARRRMQKPGKHKTYMTTLSGTATDSITKKGVKDIIVEVGTEKKLITTDINGYFEKKIYKKYATQVVFSLPGIYIPLIIEISKKELKNIMVINVELQRINSTGSTKRKTK